MEGVVTVDAPGEGEAMCAALDALGPPHVVRCIRYRTELPLGLVDGCVTRDADAFAFGAQTVYKTFSVSVWHLSK